MFRSDVVLISTFFFIIFHSFVVHFVAECLFFNDYVDLCRQDQGRTTCIQFHSDIALIFFMAARLQFYFLRLVSVP